MTDWIWLNGEIIPLSEARIGVEDRGFQFADGVYQVVRLYRGKPFTLNPHLERLEQSAKGIELGVPLDRAVLGAEVRKLIDKSSVRDGMVYLQLTRGAAPRNHLFPAATRSTLLFYARPLPPPYPPGEGEGIKLLAVTDERWRRCWLSRSRCCPTCWPK